MTERPSSALACKFCDDSTQLDLVQAKLVKVCNVSSGYCGWWGLSTRGVLANVL